MLACAILILTQLCEVSERQTAAGMKQSNMVLIPAWQTVGLRCLTAEIPEDLPKYTSACLLLHENARASVLLIYVRRHCFY